MYLYTVYVYGQPYSLQYYWDARYIYMYTDARAVQLKLTQQCRSTILQKKRTNHKNRELLSSNTGEKILVMN